MKLLHIALLVMVLVFVLACAQEEPEINPGQVDQDGLTGSIDDANVDFNEDEVDSQISSLDEDLSSW